MFFLAVGLLVTLTPGTLAVAAQQGPAATCSLPDQDQYSSLGVQLPAARSLQAANTGGLSFVRGGNAPSWLIDVVWGLVASGPGGVGGSTRAPSVGTWVWGGGGTHSRGSRRRAANSDEPHVSETIDDYSELWQRYDLGSDTRGYDRLYDPIRCDERQGLDNATTGREYGREELLAESWRDDRSDDRYVNPR
jgi:hypothetical protein